jgi:hypothetical protein
MKKLILLGLGAAAAYKLAKHYNVTLDDVKTFVTDAVGKVGKE